MAAAPSTEAARLNLSNEEKQVYGQLFRQADFDNVGVVTGEVAVKFFEKTRLDSRILGEIWQISDKENRGFLTPAGFSTVLRLIGHAQAGREPTAELALQSGPIPRFDGLSGLASGLASPPPPAALQAQGTGGGPVRIPPLMPEKVVQYAGLFERQPLQEGNMLPGEQAKQIFEKSGLPNEVLGRIWQLADTEQRGALVQTEFVIAMHLLSSMKAGTLAGLPTILPAGLYDAATRRGPVGSAPRQSPIPTGPVSAIPRQLSGSAQFRTGSPLGRQLTGQAPTMAVGGSDWLITPAEKSKFDVIFDDLDKTRKGFITGEEAVPFFSMSNLNGDVLAQIWDLADINSEGHLNRDEFAIAMHLIRQQRTRRDGANVVPTTLPPNLIPPSMRNQIRPSTANSAFDIPPQAAPAPAPAPPAPPAPRSALDDLFGLDAPAPSAPAQAPMPTGGSTASDPFGSGSVGIAPTSPSKLSPSRTATQFKPFVPSSSFGRGLTHHATGEPAAQPKPAVVTEDLLGDADPEISSKLTNDSTELANISNQISSLSKQMQTVQGQRTTTQNDLNQTNAQKKNFEQRLAQLRTMYEKEVKDVRVLEEQLTAARHETKKLQNECLTLEGLYQDLQAKRQQVLAGLQADQQENTSLKDKIRAVNAEIAQIKPQIEKMKSEARQQKGLVAINKKQLSTNEGERDKLMTEKEDLAKGQEELAKQTTGSSSVQIGSPTPSAGSGNNPFFKRTASTDIMATFASPTMKASDKSFDDIFGPSPAATSTPPPATSFKAQNTGTSTASAASFSTPAASTPNVSRQATLNVEPPAPPESRQITSSFLPFADPPESLTSSRQVSPPTSRAGDDTAAPKAVAAAEEADKTGQSTMSTTTGTNGAGGEPQAADALGVEDVNAPPAPAEASPAGNSDPFGTLDQAKAKADFENAFASFTKAHNKNAERAATETKLSNFNAEFPPISELEGDESDSDSDQGGGFDDDFTSSSPKGKSRQSVEAAKDSTAFPTLPTLASETAGTGLASQPPNKSSDKALSPSPFASTTSPTDDHEDIFSTLAGSAPTPTTAMQASPAPPPAAITTTAPSKGAFDDLDDEFEGLEDAKEGSADDDFANISRSGLDDFNAVFDSSPPVSQPKSESTAFGAESSFDFGTVSTNSGVNVSAAAASSITAPSTQQQPASAAPKAESQDWDALFAGLDSPAAEALTETPSNSGGNTTAPEANDTRPTPGRALTEEGLHDDPILKNLTSMGYSRADALQALEKYDYNLERAANYLASQS